MGFAIPLSTSTSGGRNSSPNFADLRGTGLISFTIRPQHLWSLPVNYALSTVPFINIALRLVENLRFQHRVHASRNVLIYVCMYVCTYPPTYHLFYALRRSSSELLINRQWELSKVERTGDTAEDASEPFGRGN